MSSPFVQTASNKKISSNVTTQQIPMSSGASVSRSSDGNIAECMYEFLLAEVLHWIEAEAEATVKKERQTNRDLTSDEPTTGVSADWGTQREGGSENPDMNTAEMEKEREMAFERAAAKIESIGYQVGYRLCERLAQTKPSLTMAVTVGDADASLEAVKFLCKEFWIEVFGKQIDKLQTNHRGIFVLKDNELLWLRRLPADDERSRVAAIKLLAFPCGLIRGALSNLGISTLVSCDFLSDGKNMASCSFNIKVKS